MNSYKSKQMRKLIQVFHRERGWADCTVETLNFCPSMYLRLC